MIIVRAGALTTVQDLGRRGLGSIGVSPAGAMDPVALRIGNLLVGNDDGDAGIEFTLLGPTIRFRHAHVIALTGSRFRAGFEDGTEAPHNTAFRVRAGSTLTLGPTQEGARGYLAIRGGVDAPLVLGSRSTHVTGGIEPRTLHDGDTVDTLHPHSTGRTKRLRLGILLPYAPHRVVRVVLGPQADRFPDAALVRFFDAPWRVSPLADRAGIRLDGPTIEYLDTADIDPEGTAPGAIQVPADGRPIVLGVERPATGGYAKIGTVASADFGLMAQAKPGDTILFEPITPDAARAAWRQIEAALRVAIEDA